MKYERRAEQEEWKQRCSDAFLEHDYVLGQAPCGFGKSTVFAEITKSRSDAGSRVLLVAPQAEIIDQISDRLLEFGVVHGFQSSGYAQIPEARVQLGTPLSIMSNIRKGWDGAYDLVVEDECHRAVSKTYLSLHEALYSQNPHHYRFGVTATPVRMDNKPLRASFQHLVPGPKNRELVELGRLVRLVVKSPPCAVDFSGLRNPDASMEKQSALLNNKKFHGTVLQAIEEEGADLQTLVHATTVAHARDLAKELRLAGLNVATLDGGLSRSERKNIVADYRKGLLNYLVSIELGITGFDVPGVLRAIWARRTQSIVVWDQGNGRVQRPFLGKTKGIIKDLCANAYRLGTPDVEREWSLEGGVMTPAALHLVRQCQKCYAWITNGERSCTECDTEFTAKERKFQYSSGGQLVEVKDIKPKQKSQKLKDYKSEEKLIDVDDPRAYELTLELCERYGYQKGFAAVRLRMRKKYRAGGWATKNKRKQA